MFGDFFLNAFHPSWGRLLPPKTATPTPVGFGFRVYIPPASRVQIPARDLRSLFFRVCLLLSVTLRPVRS